MNDDECLIFIPDAYTHADFTAIEARARRLRSECVGAALRRIWFALFGSAIHQPSAEDACQAPSSLAPVVAALAPVEPDRPTCSGCGCEIDPDVCWCGAKISSDADHHDGHVTVPMGCECGYAPREWMCVGEM